MKNKILSLFLLTLISCDFQDESAGYVDPMLKPYWIEFTKQAEIRGIYIDPTVSFTIHFGNLENQNACGLTIWKSSQVEIVIDSSSACWSASGPFDKEALVFHEFGHMRGRAHDNTFINIGRMVGNIPSTALRAKSLMIPGVPVSYKDNRKYYLDELFNPMTLPPKDFK